MKRILVTGGNGFVGRPCLTLLKDHGFEVHSVTRRTPPRDGSTQWHCANVRDIVEMQLLLSNIRPTHLLHLAWETQPGAFWASPENLPWLRSSVALFHAFEQSGGMRIVGTGSCAEYDWTAGPCRERKTPCRPNTAYGRAKLAASTYLDAMQHAKLSTAWARLFFLFGPHASKHRMPGVIIDSLHRHEHAKCASGTQRRDFLHVNDAARGIVSLVDSEVTGPINICSGVEISIGWMAQYVADLMGKAHLLQIGETASSDHNPHSIVGDNNRLREEVGWHATLSLEDGLRETVAGWPINAPATIDEFTLQSLTGYERTLTH